MTNILYKWKSQYLLDKLVFSNLHVDSVYIYDLKRELTFAIRNDEKINDAIIDFKQFLCEN